jgi:hypothetical protein
MAAPAGWPTSRARLPMPSTENPTTQAGSARASRRPRKATDRCKGMLVREAAPGMAPLPPSTIADAGASQWNHCILRRVRACNRRIAAWAVRRRDTSTTRSPHGRRRTAWRTHGPHHRDAGRHQCQWGHLRRLGDVADGPGRGHRRGRAGAGARGDRGGRRDALHPPRAGRRRAQRLYAHRSRRGARP